MLNEFVIPYLDIRDRTRATPSRSSRPASPPSAARPGRSARRCPTWRDAEVDELRALIAKVTDPTA